jgi:NADPH2:quinone reductase
MKAVLCKAYGPPESLVVEERESPSPGPGEVVISVKAASGPSTSIIRTSIR